MLRKKALAALLVSLFAVALFGGDWASILKQIKAKYADYNREVKDITILREIEMNTPQGKLTADAKMFKKGEKFRVETSVKAPNMPEGMQVVVINDGEDVWMINPFMGKQKLPADKRKEYERQGEWWNWLSENGKLIGSEVVDGRACHVIQFEIVDALFTRLWLEQKDFVVVKAEFEGENGHKGVVVFSDYHKLMNKWEMPYKMEIYIDDQLQSTMETKSVEINKGLSDDLFDPDKVEIRGNMEEMMRKMREQMMKKGGE